MADDRPLDDLPAAVAELRAQYADMKSTLYNRSSRLPTGFITGTFLATPLKDTLFLQGQAVLRATYPILWQWVQDNSMIATGLFTVGDGSTTFGIPDLRGRVLRGASAATGVLTGADAVTLLATQMPLHNHTGSTATDTHQHVIAFDNGNHGGHFPAAAPTNVANGTGTVFGLAAWNAGATGNTAHNHGGGTSNDGHSHGVTINNAGNATPATVDVRQAGIDINWLIWT